MARLVLPARKKSFLKWASAPPTGGTGPSGPFDGPVSSPSDRTKSGPLGPRQEPSRLSCHQWPSARASQTARAVANI